MEIESIPGPTSKESKNSCVQQSDVRLMFTLGKSTLVADGRPSAPDKVEGVNVFDSPMKRVHEFIKLILLNIYIGRMSL